MTEKQRFNYRQLIGSIIGSIIVFMIGFSVTASRDDSKELAAIINGKLDKAAYEVQCDKTDVRLTQLESNQADILKEMNKALQIIAVQNATMQSDIGWIKQELKRGK